MELVEVKPHPLNGIQLIYRHGRYGLSQVDAPALHSYAFHHEFAVLDWGSVDGTEWRLTYDTPLTEDVVVTLSQEDTDMFLAKAEAWFREQDTQ